MVLAVVTARRFDSYSLPKTTTTEETTSLKEPTAEVVKGDVSIVI